MPTGRSREPPGEIVAQLLVFKRFYWRSFDCSHRKLAANHTPRPTGQPGSHSTTPGVSWEGPPAQGEWEPVSQGGATEGGAQDRSDAREQRDESTERRQEQDLIVQQTMAEQARRMADLTFWQIVVGAAVLVGLGITIYYTRQTARAAVSAVDLSRQAYLTEHRTRVRAHPIGAQRADAAQPNQRDKIGP
jgi:hypothetical protein